MVSKKVEAALNKQIVLEGESSQFYLSMASWAENQGYVGTAEFLYRHADEERQHMLKLVRYINERGGIAKIPSIAEPPVEFESLTTAFENLLKHELKVTAEINNIVHTCLEEKDYTTHNFIQWYVSEQIEEEATARGILDRIKLTGSEKGGLYLFDRDLENLTGGSISVPDAGK
ncbi:MAG: ferritin [Flavobacteriales bacterium]|nr:ferritin [Flavobacteriales bacterium]|tara:strand:+ start:4444 stop:4965 length:522 start_codon:yes stop_codon:yes gene_type:complete